MDIFALLALVGLILSLIVHGATYLDVDVQTHAPYVWLLHLGVFVVFIPSVIVQNRRQNANGGGSTANRPRKRDPFEGMPRWIRTTAGVLFIYAMVNFGLFVFQMQGSPHQIHSGGGYELRNHGKLIRTITPAEYQHYRALEVRGASGHWMLFYGVSMLTLFGRRYTAQPSQER